MPRRLPQLRVHGSLPWDALGVCACLVAWQISSSNLIPLLIYRSLRIKPASKLKHPKVTYGLTALLALDVVVSAVALVNTLSEVFIATFIAGIAVLIVQAAIEDRKTWITWLIVGVFIASIVSGVFGVGALAAFGKIPMAIFSQFSSAGSSET